MTPRRGHVPEGADADPAGEQGGGAVARLQRAVHVGDGAGGHAVPAGVHVPGHPAAAQLHELRRAAAARPHALPHRHPRHIPHLQEELQVWLVEPNSP